MANVLNIEEIQKTDPQNTLGSTDQLVRQCEHAWKEVHSLDLPDWTEFTPQNIVMCGMGASMYGAIVLKSLIFKNLPCPFEIVSDYQIPEYVNSQSLVILTSYSGSTEETVTCANTAIAKGAKILIITKGGELANLAKTHNIPSYVFDGKLNPAGVPRLGNGYTIVGLMALISKMNIFTLDEGDITDGLTRLHEKQEDLKTLAITQSEQLIGKTPIIIAGEHLTGNAHILRNQFNETSKSFSSFFLVPDLNHHLMEGLQFPQHNPLVFLSLMSKNYSERIQKRFELTKDVVNQNGFEVIEFRTSARTVYDDSLETMIYGSYLSLFLGLRYDQNPAINPWVDYFKEKLK